MAQLTRNTLRFLAGLTALTMALLTPARAKADGGDFLGYPVDSEVKIYINWNSFVDQEIPNAWRDRFTDAVINAYTRWMHVGGFRLRPKFIGYTTATTARAGEIVIMMNEKHATSTRLASRFGSPALIVFHRKSGATGTPWNFVPYRAAAGEIDMQAVLMHELGHAFGLEHEDSDPRSTMNGGHSYFHRYGPTANDLTDIRALYGVRDNYRFKIKRTDEIGATWTNLTTNLTSIGVVTTGESAPVRDNLRTILYYTSSGKRPAFIHGSWTGSSFDTSKWWSWGGYPSMYGIGAAGGGTEYMFTWADYTGDAMRVRVAYSADGGLEYVLRDPPGSPATTGTPAIARLTGNTWVLAYTKLDLGSVTNTARVVARVSTNDGATWGPESVLSTLYYALGGISMVAVSPTEVRIGLSWADRVTSANYRTRVLKASVADGVITYGGAILREDYTRTSPALARTTNKLFMAFRGTNAATSLLSRLTEVTGSSFGTPTTPVASSPIPGGFGAFSGSLNAYLYYVE